MVFRQRSESHWNGIVGSALESQKNVGLIFLSQLTLLYKLVNLVAFQLCRCDGTAPAAAGADPRTRGYFIMAMFITMLRAGWACGDS